MTVTDEKLKAFEDRIEKLKQLKTSKETEVKMLSAQYDNQVAALKDLGITDLQDLPKTITTLSEEISTKEAQLEKALSDLEAAVL